jgi:DNA-binding beta-propeller fold protein YncE
MLTALAAAGCAALWMATAGGAAAAHSVAAAPHPVSVRVAQVERSGAVRPWSALLAGAGQAAPGPLAGAAQASPGWRGGFVVLDGSPGTPVADPKTGTIYVPIQCTTRSCTTPGHVVDILSAAKCNANVISGCRVVARAKVGTNPLAAAIDPRTRTVYVMNGGSNTVSVLNGARCNSQVTRGCGPVATIKVGKFPVAGVVNPVTRTLYVANLFGRSISVINVARCNAHVTLECRQPARTVTDKAGPDWIDVNTATDTVYAANSGTADPPAGHTVSVINGATCNGHTGRGCGRIAATVKVGVAPFGLAVDQARDTIYVANFVNEFGGGSVSVINGARCNAHTRAGCGVTPPAVPTGIATSFVAVDGAVHTAFAIIGSDDTMSAINTRTCNGTVTSSCASRPPNQQAAPEHGPGYHAFPNGFALTPRTSTAYVVTIGGRNILSVLSTRHCNAANTAGCRAEAPTAPEEAFLLSADPATSTVYAGNLHLPQIDVINSATCHARDLSGCAPVAEIPMGDSQANVGSIDEATHTLYASDPFSDTTSVINTDTCNATHTSGCAARPPAIKVGVNPGPPALNPATGTLYVPYGPKFNRVAVINAATCNATDTSGCGQTPAAVRVGEGTFGLAVSIATNTVYGPNGGSEASGFIDGRTVSVINGATCDAANTSGCGQLAATATVGLNPTGIAVNDRTHTVYAAINAHGDSPGTVSIINTATCNGTVTAGCHRRFPTAPTGNSPAQVTVDPRTSVLYVSNFSSASVTILNGRRCNAETTTRCRRAGREQAIGSGPQGITVNPRTRTVYVANLYMPGSLSVFHASRG